MLQTSAGKRQNCFLCSGAGVVHHIIKKGEISYKRCWKLAGKDVCYTCQSYLSPRRYSMWSRMPAPTAVAPPLEDCPECLKREILPVQMERKIRGRVHEGH